MLHHMLERKNNNVSLPYDELITKILTYIGYELIEEEPKIMHTKIGKGIIRKWDITLKEEKLFLYLQERQDNKEAMTSLNSLKTLSIKYVMNKGQCTQRLTSSLRKWRKETSYFQ